MLPEPASQLHAIGVYCRGTVRENRGQCLRPLLCQGGFGETFLNVGCRCLSDLATELAVRDQGAQGPFPCRRLVGRDQAGSSIFDDLSVGRTLGVDPRNRERSVLEVFVPVLRAMEIGFGQWRETDLDTERSRSPAPKPQITTSPVATPTAAATSGKPSRALLSLTFDISSCSAIAHATARSVSRGSGTGNPKSAAAASPSSPSRVPP